MDGFHGYVGPVRYYRLGIDEVSTALCISCEHLISDVISEEVNCVNP